MADGRQQQVITDDKIKKALADLFDDEKQPPRMPPDERKGTPEYKYTRNDETGRKSKINALESEQVPALAAEARQARKELENHLDIMKKHQENTKKSTALQAEILKGIKKGEAEAVLLLKAVEAISLMTGNELFFLQASEDLRAIYGRGLQSAPLLAVELEGLETRLNRLRDAEGRETDANTRKRIRGAITEHEREIKHVQSLLDDGQSCLARNA